MADIFFFKCLQKDWTDPVYWSSRVTIFFTKLSLGTCLSVICENSGTFNNQVTLNLTTNRCIINGKESDVCYSWWPLKNDCNNHSETHYHVPILVRLQTDGWPIDGWWIDGWRNDVVSFWHSFYLWQLKTKIGFHWEGHILINLH